MDQLLIFNQINSCNCMDHSGGSRIFAGGANPRGGGHRHTILLNFSKKLHEIE